MMTVWTVKGYIPLAAAEILLGVVLLVGPARDVGSALALIFIGVFTFIVAVTLNVRYETVDETELTVNDYQTYAITFCGVGILLILHSPVFLPLSLDSMPPFTMFIVLGAALSYLGYKTYRKKFAQ